jgi:hypothetical protein
MNFVPFGLKVDNDVWISNFIGQMNGDEFMDEKWKDSIKQLINSINGWISSNSNKLQYMNYVSLIKLFFKY